MAARRWSASREWLVRRLWLPLLVGCALIFTAVVAQGITQSARAVGANTATSRTRLITTTARTVRSRPTSVRSISHRARSLSRAATAPKPAVVRVPSSASLGPLRTIVQTLNNCGPASVAEVLAYWHVDRSQGQVGAVLRGDSSPWGMAPYGVPFYARSVGLRGMVGVAGNERVIKALVANGFPVIVSQWVSATDPIRHYRPIEAFNDRTQTFVSADPYLGAGHVISYAEFQSLWSVSDDRFLLVYPVTRQARLDAVLASAGWAARRAYVQDLAWQRARMRNQTLQRTNTWLSHNGYAALAWDEAHLGQFKAAQTDLSVAQQRGTSPILIGWVRQEIRQLEHPNSR